MKITRFENHHVAGRANDAEWTVPVCVDCHRVLSNWQLVAGVPLSPRDHISDGDRYFAALVGVAFLGEIAFRIFGRMVGHAAGYRSTSRQRRS